MPNTGKRFKRLGLFFPGYNQATSSTNSHVFQVAHDRDVTMLMDQRFAHATARKLFPDWRRAEVRMIRADIDKARVISQMQAWRNGPL